MPHKTVTCRKSSGDLEPLPRLSSPSCCLCRPCQLLPQGLASGYFGVPAIFHNQPTGASPPRRPTGLSYAATQTAAVPQSSPPSFLMPMSQILPENLISAVLRASFPGVTVQGTKALPSPRPQRIYEVNLSDNRRFVLVMAPSSMLRLLRSEQSMITSEAVVLRWIKETLSTGLPDEKRQEVDLSPTGAEARPSDNAKMVPDSVACKPGDTGGLPEKACNGRCGSPCWDLARFLPALIAQSSIPADLGAPFNLFEDTGAVPISSLPRPLSISERRRVDFQAGRLARRLSRLVSPSGRFGPAAVVLSHPASPPLFKRSGTPATNTAGVNTWSMAFHGMLEAILRDGEDMAVNFPYALIRKHFRRLGHLLDAVTTPSLVAMDALDHSNLMVVTLPRSDCHQQIPEDQRRTTTREDDDSSNKPIDADVPDTGKSEDATRQRGERQSEGKEDETRLEVVGLRDWSNCVFGDPLMASALCNESRADFMLGFHATETGGRISPSAEERTLLPAEPSTSTKTTADKEDKTQGGNSGSDGDGDGGGRDSESEKARVRLLLYQCYHATVCIVKEFYRPRGKGSQRELAARRRLTDVLGRLEDLSVPGRLRHRRPSGEMSPAKRPRPDGGRGGAE